MSRLVYSAIASLDGYVVDADGSFEWAAPDQELHTAVNVAERPIGTYLYGRRRYEVLAAWETLESDGFGSGAVHLAYDVRRAPRAAGPTGRPEEL